MRNMTVSAVRMAPAIIANRQCPTAVPSPSQQDFSQSSTANLAEAIASSLTLNRLFADEPLKFVGFKMSFTTLVDK